MGVRMMMDWEPKMKSLAGLWQSRLCLSSLLVPFFVFVASVGTIPAQAQEQDQAPIRVDVSLVMLDATVKNKAGQIMGDLKKEDFEVREDGVRQNVALFSRDELPLNVALVVDLSDSIGPFFAALHDAATATLASLKPEDAVALVTFSTKAELRTPLTTDKTAIADQFNSFKAGGATNISDGIFVAARYFLTAAPKGRRVIILISDDVSTLGGGETTQDLVTEATAADTSIYNLKIPGYNPGISYMPIIPGLLSIPKVAEQTGGEIFDVPNAASLDAVFHTLLQRIRTRYTLGYYTSANGAQGKPHKLDVRLASSFGTKGRNYMVLAKSGYYFVP
jgi:Ca-activated chloride channel family protein